jgi:hypothetical protein
MPEWLVSFPVQAICYNIYTAGRYTETLYNNAVKEKK